MTREAARLAITQQMEAALQAYSGTKPKVQYPNRNLIDPATQTVPYVDLDIVYLTGEQLDLNPKPMSAQYGQIIITALCKENTGEREAGLLLDYFLPWFDMKELGIVRTHSAFHAKSTTANMPKGWVGFPVTVPFWWVRVAA